jgi:outer membrane receptor for ferrienterochelin and colicins
MFRPLILLLSFVSINAFSQDQFIAKVVDADTKDPLQSSVVNVEGTFLGRPADSLGQFVFNSIPPGEFIFIFSAEGYLNKVISLKFPREETLLMVIKLERDEELDIIIVEATRFNRSIADTPTRTEVLTEEIDEAASMEPSKIAHLITHSTGIQVQTTSATSNGAVVRIQGLKGRYTQILKDGFPLYGGFSGSLDVLQIAPLDLRQVEYIKGSASTLYGGGAIGGLINLLSKKPSKPETLLHLNASHIGGRDLNLFASNKFGKWGFTNLASFHVQRPYDPDKDGYSDIPNVLKLNFNPRIFFYPDERTELYLGAMITVENRMGGDMKLINKGVPDMNNFYFDRQESQRFTTQFSVSRETKKGNKINFKNSVSSFDRFIHIRKDALGNESKFAGKQNNSFTEFNFDWTKAQHQLIYGLNIYTEDFEERELDTSALRNQLYFTYGLFANHLWDINEKWAIESGLRFDFATASSKLSYSTGEAFLLPRVSLLWKAIKALSIRLGGGMGYRMPSVFSEEAEPLAYENVNTIDFKNVSAERSYNGNLDFKFTHDFGRENILFSLNQMFFYNVIDNPILLSLDSTGGYNYANSAGLVHARGFESQMKFTFRWFTWFVGYTYTDAYLDDAGLQNELILTPKHSIKGDLLFVIDKKWRIGWDYEYKSQQKLSTGFFSRGLFTTGVVVERTLKNFVIFVKAENFTDVRQSRYQSTLTSPFGTPQYTDIWAPLDGFFFNAGLKIKL